MKTFIQKQEEVVRSCYLIDAEGKVLGRLATKLASMLRGKEKPEFTPHVDSADEIIVINADKIRVTGKKMTDKIYQRYSGYPGGQKSFSLEVMLKKSPEDVLRLAVRGMLPHNALGRQQLRRLKIYAGTAHPHSAQKPQVYSV